MIAAQAPVGQRVHWLRGEPQPSFPGFEPCWVDSGTSALGLAVSACLRAVPGRRVVLVPAYGCPDLVSAVTYAGGEVRLVDIGAEDPGYDLAALEAACREDVAAVIDVNFLGIADRMPAVESVCRSRGALLLDDCAQWFPEAAPICAVDARIVSFGRGKPVNLLGGGALLLPAGGRLHGAVPAVSGEMPGLGRLKADVFNALLAPVLYGAISRLPGLQLGETRYHELAAPRAMDEVRRSLLGANAAAWLERSGEREERLGEVLAALPGLKPLPTAVGDRRGRLLRYPVLAASGRHRDRLIEAWRAFGASPFYGRCMPEVDDVPADVARQGPFPGASEFASRVLTLPVHERAWRGKDLQYLAEAYIEPLQAIET